MAMNTTKVTLLQGDQRNPESATHIIKFPGGSIEVSRTSDEEYWVHVWVNKGQVIEGSIAQGARGSIVDTRLDYVHPLPMEDIPQIEALEHIAVRISNPSP